MENVWKQLADYLTQLAITTAPRLIGALILLVVGLKVIKKIKKWMHTSPKLEKIDGSVRSFAVSLTGILLYILLVVLIALILGVSVTSFMTLLASAGVAIGLALQGALSNFAGGLMILLFKPFKVGDYIETASESGTVKDITVVYTVLQTPDNKQITVPNGTLTNASITNYSTEPLRRVDLTFTTAYDCDIEATKALLLKEATAHPLVLTEPAEPFARLQSQGDSALVYALRVWCKREDYWTVHMDLNESVKKAFDQNGIAIPFPQMDVHINP